MADVQNNFIVERRTYLCAGQQIEELIPVHGTPPKDFSRFVGAVAIKIGLPTGIVTAQEEIPIPAANIVEAFQMFEQVFEAKKVEIQEKVQQQLREEAKARRDAKQKIVVAGENAIPTHVPGRNPHGMKLV